ncbi:hypothetical protein M9H77_23499 [Catharanthus roseus]|uniref:Uncharacterized protein n=1 Tax=Catharanthus roseus TaxID=4058 RepID=A0ACC0AU74_CATRO|nr:hypothetical protein M9H77_23499 [Catharanthus roseus]
MKHAANVYPSKGWTKKAKVGIVEVDSQSMTEIDPKAMMSFCDKDLESESSYKAKEGLLRILKEFDECLEETNFEQPFGGASIVNEVTLPPIQNSRNENALLNTFSFSTCELDKDCMNSETTLHAYAPVIEYQDLSHVISLNSLQIPYSNISQENSSTTPNLRQNPNRAWNDENEFEIIENTFRFVCASFGEELQWRLLCPRFYDDNSDAVPQPLTQVFSNFSQCLCPTFFS